MTTLDERRALLRKDFPYEAFESLVQDILAKPDGGRSALVDSASALMRTATAAMLERMRADGELGSIPGTAGHEISLVEHWTKFVAGEPGPDWRPSLHADRMAEATTVPMLISSAVGVKYDKEDGDPETRTRSAYEKLIDAVARGTTDLWHRMDDHYCSVTDERYGLQMKDWSPSLYRWGTGGKQPIQPIEPRTIRHVEIEFRTPEILIADFIRLPGMSEWLGKTDYSKPSINSEIGREQAIEHYAREKGFVHVNVGNTSPAILRSGGTFVLGRYLEYGPDDEGDKRELPDGYELVGSTCTDLWAVTMIERAVVEKVVAEHAGIALDEAARRVDAYLEQTYGVTQVAIEPGTKHLYFMGEADRFATRFASPDLPIDPEVIEPMFVLSDRELSLENEAQPGLAMR